MPAGDYRDVMFGTAVAVTTTTGTNPYPDYTSPFKDTTSAPSWTTSTPVWITDTNYTNPKDEKTGFEGPYNPYKEWDEPYRNNEIYKYARPISAPPEDPYRTALRKTEEEIKVQRRALMDKEIELLNMKLLLKKAHDALKRIEEQRKATQVQIDETKPKERKIDLVL